MRVFAGLQREAMSEGRVSAPPSVGRVLDSPGRPLDPVPRRLLEQRLGADFGAVRVHADDAWGSAHDVAAAAYTVGEHVVFAPGRYQPRTPGGVRLLAHELTHVLQQRHATATARTPLTVNQPGGADEHEAASLADLALSGGHAAPTTAALAPLQRQQPGTATRPPSLRGVLLQPAEIADEVIRLGDRGDYPEARYVLSGLTTATLLLVLDDLGLRWPLELLRRSLTPAEPDHDRLLACILAVTFRYEDLPVADRTITPGLVAALPAVDQQALRTFLGALATHQQTMFLEGAEAEAERLATLQFQELERRRQAEEAARAKAVADAAAQGRPPPAQSPKVSLGDVVAREVGSRAPPPAPTEAWTKLPDQTKNQWTLGRAPAAISAVLNSVKGTELEQVMKGHDLLFDPEFILQEGAYAARRDLDLVYGMAFVEDAERDPKNVWPVLAHEIGGHFGYATMMGAEFGTSTYAMTFVYKVLERLPEAERKRWTEGRGRQDFFTAYVYAETEIFAALRQRRYDLPASGPTPVHGAMKPDLNIETRLDSIDTAFPKEVGTAILFELNRKVQASAEILDRDKQYFLQQVQLHGYVL
jgi:hypothetical protein